MNINNVFNPMTMNFHLLFFAKADYVLKIFIFLMWERS